MHFRILQLFTTILIGSIHAEPCCPDGWVYFQNSCYMFGHHDLDFQEAENFCKHYGAHLVMIETAVENTFIKSFLSDVKDTNHYIGLVDELIEGLWKWYAGDHQANFTDWRPGQPNGAKVENCAMIGASYGYQWQDIACTNRYKPFCEKPSNTEFQIVGK